MGLEERETKRRQSIIGTIISDEKESQSEEITAQKNAVIIAAKPKAETRSKKINLLIPPSLHEKAQKKCRKIGISLNECINQFLNNWV